MKQRLVEVDYTPEEGLTLRLRPLGLVSESTRHHLIAANKEFLLALRSAVEDAIARAEERETAPRRARKVEVKGEKSATTQ